jgi:hypothetical protein
VSADALGEPATEQLAGEEQMVHDRLTQFSPPWSAEKLKENFVKNAMGQGDLPPNIHALIPSNIAIRRVEIDSAL